MNYVSTHLKALAGILCLSFALAQSAYALDSSLYLNASASQASSVQSLDTSLDLKADATTSRDAGENTKEHRADVQASSSANTYMEQASSRYLGLWSFFQSKASTTASLESQSGFWARLLSLLHLNVLYEGTSTSSGAAGAKVQTLAHVRIQDVGATKATVSWSPSSVQAVSVYYATSSPVVVASSTLHVSPWKFWGRQNVTLKKLVPDTTYFYTVAAETTLGMITTSEASFRTLAK